MERGGKNEERLYIHNDCFMYDGGLVKVKRTDMPDIEGIIIRHKARYFLPGFFVRYGMRVLDFPCGSGYGAEILSANCHVYYEGKDLDPVTVLFAQRNYGGYAKYFKQGDLTKPDLLPNHYDLIACVEGLEHIEGKYQGKLIKSFYEALKPSGRLIISTPEPTGTNPYHLHELTLMEFNGLLDRYFSNVQILTHKDTLHNGEKVTCLYGICQKEGEWKS